MTTGTVRGLTRARTPGTGGKDQSKSTDRAKSSTSVSPRNSTGTGDGEEGEHGETEHEGRSGRDGGTEPTEAEYGGAGSGGDARSGAPKEGERNQHDGELGEATHAGIGEEDAEPLGDGEEDEDAELGGRIGCGVDGEHEGAGHRGASGANTEGEHKKPAGTSREATAEEHDGPDDANVGRKAEPPAVGKRLCEGTVQRWGAKATSRVGA